MSESLTYSWYEKSNMDHAVSISYNHVLEGVNEITEYFSFSALLPKNSVISKNADNTKTIIITASNEKQGVTIVDNFEIDNKKVIMNKPYIFDFKVSKKGYFTHDKYLGIYCFDETYEELLFDLKENIYLVYKYYALKKDDELDKHARSLKRKIKDIVKEVK